MEEQLAILIIDDDMLDRMAVRRALRAAGVIGAVAEADSSAAALALLDQQRFDCILLDYLLPPTDGLTVLRELRGRGVSVPIIVLTGQGDERVAVELMKAGASDYLTKEDMAPERLAHSVRSAVRVQRAEVREAQARAESLERMRFLAEASRRLATSLDTPTILAELSHLVVPALADWCAVDLIAPGEGLARVVAHPAPGEAGEWVAELARLWPMEEAAEVARAGESLARPPVSAGLGPSPANPEVGLICVPVSLRGEIQGALTMARRPGGRPYDAADLALADDLAQRLAVAFDNARLYEEAQAAVRLRDEFLSIASHELRTPLTSLLGYVQLLERRTLRNGEASEREQRAMRVIADQVVRLNKMISSLLDVSRLQSGQFSLQLAPVDLRAIAVRAVDELRPALDGHTAQVVEDTGPLLVMADELRLHQVLQNLLQNAAKYSPAGGSIDVQLGREGEWASLTVSDQGIGIPSEAMPFLFTRFFRAANAEERKISGIGLGLYVVHEIVELHGGRIEVDSRLGQGSAFRICLPLAAEEELAVSGPERRMAS